jgi:ankyrin repeat protein
VCLTDAVEFLIKLGAGINEQNLAGDTPLHKAVEKNSLSIVQFLLKKGAIPDVKNKKGQTPITHSKSTEMRKILKDRTHELELNSIGISTGPSVDADNDMVCGDDDSADEDE